MGWLTIWAPAFFPHSAPRTQQPAMDSSHRGLRSLLWASDQSKRKGLKGGVPRKQSSHLVFSGRWEQVRSLWERAQEDEISSYQCVWMYWERLSWNWGRIWIWLVISTLKNQASGKASLLFTPGRKNIEQERKSALAIFHDLDIYSTNIGMVT